MMNRLIKNLDGNRQNKLKVVYYTSAHSAQYFIKGTNMKKTLAAIAMFALSSAIQAYDPLDNIQDTKYELTNSVSYQTNMVFDLDFNGLTGGHVIIDNTYDSNQNIDQIKQLRLKFDGLKDITFNNVINVTDQWYSYGVAKNAWIFRNVVVAWIEGLQATSQCVRNIIIL